MLLLVSGRHVGAHPDGQQHVAYIQISINLGKRFVRIFCLKNCCDLNVGKSLPQILGLNPLLVFSVTQFKICQNKKIKTFK